MATIIVAADEAGIIGDDLTIPWHLPEDLRLFKEKTMGNSVIMGRRTWDSLPKKPLPKRINYVVSRSVPVVDHASEESPYGPIFCKSLNEAVDDAKRREGQVYIIGGEEIYKVALETGCVKKIILSLVKGHHEGNKFFSVPTDFKETYREHRVGFDVVHYER